MADGGRGLRRRVATPTFLRLGGLGGGRNKGKRADKMELGGVGGGKE